MGSDIVVRRGTARASIRGDRAAHAALDMPPLRDLADWLVFAPATGRIWFDKQRTLLMHAGTFGVMRREILQALGPEAGRAALERIGFAQGKRDAELVRERFPAEHQQPNWSAGPRLHTLEGFVNVTPIPGRRDPAAGVVGEYLWSDSVEADEHVAAFGPASSPVCWTLIGYAAGYASTIQDTPIVLEEVECAAAGHTHCRVIARYAGQAAPAAPKRARAAPTGDLRLDAAPPADQAIIGVSAPLLYAQRMLEQVAGTQATVLLRGESGVGKELFAKTLHGLSPRRDKPFVAVNCAALPETLIEAELFGVDRGAFTGATGSRPGRFERANGGTLFLDEIGLMSMPAQAKLLRALQNQEIERVGGTRSMRVDVRVVAATNVDLWREAQADRFRRDLFFRLNVFPIDLPPLRARRNDLPLLIEHFIRHYAAVHGKPVKRLTGAALETLLNYDYPGNVRELQNLIERGVICADTDGIIDQQHIFRPGEKRGDQGFTLGLQGRLHPADDPPAWEPAAWRPVGEADARGGPTLPELERRLCAVAVNDAAGNIAMAARRLGISRATLEYRLRKWGLTGQGRTRGTN